MSIYNTSMSGGGIEDGENKTGGHRFFPGRRVTFYQNNINMTLSQNNITNEIKRLTFAVLVITIKLYLSSIVWQGGNYLLLNQATDYAFRAVLYLSNLPAGKVVEAKVISESQHIPLRFLLKILRMLAKAGIVRSYQGVGGGYALGKKPAEITLKDVLEAIEGPIRINKCLIDPAYCNKQGAAHCAVHRVLGDIQRTISEEFGKYNFEQLKGYRNE